MKVAIVGSPRYKDETRLFPIMSQFIDEFTHSNVTILTGSMEGAERLAGRFANMRGLDCVIFRPVKPVDNRIESIMTSVFIRNKHIVDNATKILAFWDGESPETAHLIKYAKAKEVPCMIISLV